MTNELVKVDNDKVVTELRTVSEYFGKTIGHLNRDINKLIDLDDTLRNEFIETTYTDLKGEERRTYLITQEGFALLVMGFTGKKALQWKREFYRQYQSKLEETEQKLHLLHWDNYASTLGERLYTVTEVGQLVGMIARRLNKVLADMNIQRREKGVWVVMDEIKECGFVHITSYEHDNGVSILTKWTEKGKNFIVKLLGAEKDIVV